MFSQLTWSAASLRLFCWSQTQEIPISNCSFGSKFCVVEGPLIFRLIAQFNGRSNIFLSFFLYINGQKPKLVVSCYRRKRDTRFLNVPQFNHQHFYVSSAHFLLSTVGIPFLFLVIDVLLSECVFLHERTVLPCMSFFFSCCVTVCFAAAWWNDMATMTTRLPPPQSSRNTNSE